MDISENGIKAFEASLRAYPSKLDKELESYIKEAFINTKNMRKYSYNFINTVEYAEKNDMINSKDYEEIDLWQYHQDLAKHMDINEGDFMGKSFTFAFNVIKKFAKKFPQYILRADVLAREVEIPVPEPICILPPGSRVSFYLYTPHSDGCCDLHWYKKTSDSELEATLWRFTTFDIPLLEWMIAKAKADPAR